MPAPTPHRLPPRARWLPVAALLASALVWGLAWLPLRALQGLGVHPLATTAAVFTTLALGLGLLQPHAVKAAATTPALWALALATGVANGAFNWGVAIGDVVRVVLLFYLMPVWTVLFARWLLKERLTRTVALRTTIALAGAIVVLTPAGAGLPWPASAGDWLGLAGGVGFALCNVLLRRDAALAPTARALAMFAGTGLMTGCVATVLVSAGTIPMPAFGAHTAIWLAVLGIGLMASNLALQYGVARLPATVSSLIMLSEILFATGSAAWLDGQPLTLPTLAGGGLIIAAALLATTE